MKCTFVVLYLPRVPIICGGFPLVELWLRVEVVDAFTLGGLDNGSDELLEERQPQKLRPVVVDKVDQKALDVRAVLILIGHDHYFAVPEGLEVFHRRVLLLVLEADDLDQVANLLVLHDLFVVRLANVQHLYRKKCCH